MVSVRNSGGCPNEGRVGTPTRLSGVASVSHDDKHPFNFVKFNRDIMPLTFIFNHPT